MSKTPGNSFATVVFTQRSGMAERAAGCCDSMNVCFDLSCQSLSPEKLVDEIGKIGAKHVMFDNLTSDLIELADQYALPLLEKSGFSVMYYLGENPLSDDWPWSGLITVIYFSHANTIIEICEEWLHKPIPPIEQMTGILSTEIAKNQEALTKLGARLGSQMQFKRLLEGRIVADSRQPNLVLSPAATLVFLQNNQ